MPPTKDFVRFLAAWALLHESADEAWRAAVARGRRAVDGVAAHVDAAAPVDAGAFSDALAALVDDETSRLRGRLAEGPREEVDAPTDVGPALAALRFEVAELRGRMESLQASVDAVAARLTARDGEAAGG